MPDTTQESDLTPQEQKERKKAIIIIGILACIILLGVAVIAVIYVNTTVPVTIIADYEDSFGSGVIQLETVRQLDDKTFYAVSNALLYPYDAEPAVSLSADACSCLFVSRNTSNGNQTIMGRNMDYDVTNKPAWVFYVDSGGKYASFNMGYLGNDISVSGMDFLPSMEEISKTKTIPAFTAAVLPYIVTDAVNEKGLVIEAHMRDVSEDLICYGTNLGAATRICSAFLTRYLIDSCADINDVLEHLEIIDVYSPHNDIMNTNFAFGIMDATGRYGVLEFVSDKAVWHEGQPGHTNFWIDGDAQNITGSCAGLGRWNNLEAAYPVIAAENESVKAMAEMQDALKSVYKSQFFRKTTPDETTYDVIYDCSRDIPEIVILAAELNKTLNIPVNASELEAVQKIFSGDSQYFSKNWDGFYLTNPANRENITTSYNFVTHFFDMVPDDILIEKNLLRTSVFSYVTTNELPVLHVRFFENDSIYDFGFNAEGEFV